MSKKLVLDSSERVKKILTGKNTFKVDNSLLCLKKLLKRKEDKNVQQKVENVSCPKQEVARGLLCRVQQGPVSWN